MSGWMSLNLTKPNPIHLFWALNFLKNTKQRVFVPQNLVALMKKNATKTTADCDKTPRAKNGESLQIPPRVGIKSIKSRMGRYKAYRRLVSERYMRA